MKKPRIVFLALLAVCMALPLLLYATYLLGPVMQGRYLYPFVCVLPLFALRRKTIQEPIVQEDKTHGV